MTMVYSWKQGAHPSIEAQLAGEELERIRVENNGRLESGLVVEAARPDEAPLHPAFTWDDQEAADLWRNEQARYLIRSIAVQVEKADGTSEPIRAFVSVVRDEDRSFTSIEHALSDAELRAQVVSEAWRELEAWRKRHAELIEFAKVFTAIEQARAA